MYILFSTNIIINRLVLIKESQFFKIISTFSLIFLLVAMFKQNYG